MSSSTVIVVLVVIVASCLLAGAAWWLVSRRGDKSPATPQVPAPVGMAEPPPEDLGTAPDEPAVEALAVEEVVASDTNSAVMEEPEAAKDRVEPPATEAPEAIEVPILSAPTTDPAAAVYDASEAVIAAESLVMDPEPEFDLSPSIDKDETTSPTHRAS